MSVLLWILGSTVLVSLIAFVGVFVLALKEEFLKKILLVLVSLSAGVMLGGAFLHLIPEAVEFSESAFGYVLVGFGLFFFIEKVLHWRHCHEGKCPVHLFGYMNLVGDCVHNFIDGLIVAASYVVSVPLGIASTIAVGLHEIPQEIGDFGVLVHSGISKRRALLLNFLCATSVVFGGLVGYFISGFVEGLVVFLLPLAAGGFIYVAAGDLIPEIRKELGKGNSVVLFLTFVFGILLMWGLRAFG